MFPIQRINWHVLYFLWTVTAAEVFVPFWMVETKTKWTGGRGRPFRLLTESSLVFYACHTFSAPSLDTNGIHNCLHCHSHLASALIRALPSVGRTVPVYLNEFPFLIRIAWECAFSQKLTRLDTLLLICQSSWGKYNVILCFFSWLLMKLNIIFAYQAFVFLLGMTFLYFAHLAILWSF